MAWTNCMSFDGMKHVLLLLVSFIYVYTALLLSDWLYNEDGWTIHDAIQIYGVSLTTLLYVLSAAIYISVPTMLFNYLGLLTYNPFARAKTSSQSKETPFISFRVVTRGLYPVLVQNVTETNVKMCLKFGLKNFKFEVVTDNTLKLRASHYVREVVVPATYYTPNGSLFKARALHYCLEQFTSILSPEDWIVHLDEETMLTEQVLSGIVEFISKPESNIGQGVITYGGGDVENWLTTLMDGVRTAIDYGLFRFALQLLHRPMFGFKGSFIVIKMAIEKEIGFDFGPKESIAEDLKFALTAWDRGYKFDFVEGVMQEKSTFSLSDFIKQRKRWLIGHYHVIWNTSLPAYTKMAVLPMHVGNLLLWMNVLNTVLSIILPVPIMKWQLTMFLLMSTNFNFMIMFGNFMSLTNRRLPILVKILICVLSQLLLPVLGITEAYAALRGFHDRNKLTFDIVQKEIKLANGYTRDGVQNV